MNKTAAKIPQIQLTLRSQMEAQGITPAKLSELSGVSRQQIYLIMRSPVAIRLDTLAKLCHALGVDPGMMFDYYEEVKR